MDIKFRFPNMINTLQVTGCHFDHQQPGWHYPRHHHHLFELLYCMEGEVEQEIHRDRFTLREGEWLLIKSGVRHQSSNRSDRSYGYFNVHFDLDDTDIRSRLSAAPFRHIPRSVGERTKLGEYVKKLEGIIPQSQNINEDASDQAGLLRYELSFEERLLLQSYTLLIIHEVLRLLNSPELGPELPFQARSSAAPRPASAMTADVAHAIEEKLLSGLSGDASVSRVARELNLSRSQCSKQFAKIYGMSPRQYVSRQKLNLAKELLVTTNLPVYAIADKLGFRSASHFSRQFRRWTGQSPTDYKPRA